MTKPKSTPPAETRANAHLEERAAAVKSGRGKLLKQKEPAPAAPAEPEAASPQQVSQPTGTIPASSNATPDAYGLMIDDNGLGLHAGPGASVVVEPEMPTKAGLAVFYMKGGRGPAIFDLTRHFRSEFAHPFAPGSEVMPLIEMVDPVTGEFGRIRTDQVGTIHRITGIFTPSEIMTEHLRAPPPLPELAECPEGMGEHYVEGAAAYPLVRPGETVVYDPSRREPTDGALCVLQWSGGARDVLLTNWRASGGRGEKRWWTDPVNRPSSREVMDRRQAAGKLGMLYASDGPHTEEHLRERIVGTVVGILVPRQHPRGDDEGTPTEPLTFAASITDTPAPGSDEAKAAFKDACHQHTLRTQFANDYPELKRTPLEWWTASSLSRALETGELTPAECARLYPLATERELRMAEIEHELNLGGLFALAFADEYPVKVQEPEADGTDPIFAAIQAHADARAAFAETVNPQDCAWVRQNGGDTSDEAMAPANAAYEVAGEVEKQAWTALFETRSTTLPGVLALLRHAQQFASGNDGLADSPTMEDVFGAIADSLEAVAAASPEVLGGPCENDSVFAAIAKADQADADMASFDNDPVASSAEGARAEEDRLSNAQAAAYKAVLATVPTTTAGLRALVEYTKKQNELILGDDWQAEASKSGLGDVYLSLVAAIEAIHGAHAECHEPVTVESAASLHFEPYTFEIPLRSPRDWADAFNAHAIAMHIGDKTLRMAKPELMAFIREANKRGDDTDGIMMRALNAASETFDGWAKFLHLAGTRYLVAGASAAIENKTENGGA